MELIFQGSLLAQSSCVISYTKAVKMLQQGCQAFIASVEQVGQQKPTDFASIPVVRNFPEVFPEKLPGVPPPREVEFAIDVAPGTEPISKAPYRMAPAELKELKSQLEEMLEAGFIRPSTSAWGAPVLFVKKKDGSL